MTHLHKQEVLNFKLLSLANLFLLFAFQGLLLCHIHPLSHVLIICLCLQHLRCFLLAHLLIKLLFDVSESFLSFHLLALFIHRIPLFLFDLVLHDSPLQLLLSLVTLFNDRISHPIHKKCNLFLASLPLSLPLLLLDLHHLVVLLNSAVLLVSFSFTILEHFGLLDFVLLNDLERNLPLVLLFVDLRILLLINLFSQATHQLQFLHPLLLCLLLLQPFGLAKLHIPHLFLLEYLVLHFALLRELLLLLLAHPLKQLLFITALLLTLFISLQFLLPQLLVQDFPEVLLLLKELQLFFLLVFLKLLLLKQNDLVPFVLGKVAWQGLLVGWEVGSTLVAQLEPEVGEGLGVGS